MYVVPSPLEFRFLSDTLEPWTLLPKMWLLHEVMCLRSAWWGRKPWDEGEKVDTREEENLSKTRMQCLADRTHCYVRELGMFVMVVSRWPFNGTPGICIRKKKGVPSISYWPVPDNELGKQPLQWNRPMFAEITPLNFRFISTGLGVIGPSCFLYACPKVMLASDFISLLLSVHLLWSHLHTPQRFPLLLAFPAQFLKGPALFTPLRIDSRLSPGLALSPLTPMLHFPGLWTGRSAVTDWDTPLWLPLVNVSITSSLRQRGENP